MADAPLPPIWIVSLARAAERRAEAHAAFTARGLPFEVLEAVDGRALGTQDRRRYSPWRARFAIGRELAPGELGCALSHLRACERIVAEGHDEVLVVEDDVRPGPDLAAVLARRGALPDDRDVVTLHSLFASAGPVPVDAPPLPGGRRVCRFTRIPFGTQCYLLTRRAAARLLEVAYPVRLPADELLFRRRPAGLRVYGIEPSPVVHADAGSELGVPPESHSRGPARIVELGVIAAGKAWTRATRPSRVQP